MTSKLAKVLRVSTVPVFAAMLLSGCQGGLPFGSGSQDAPIDSAPQSVQLVERDVEAPEVFQKTESGLWDGRPSLGGVWVAHPDVLDPERVIIRNQSNNKFVIGALFRRERDNPGPALQVSSDAAAALGMLAGAPVQLQVVALRREEVADQSNEAVANFDEPDEITATPLDPIASAAAAIDAAEASATSAATAAPGPVRTPPAAPATAQPTTSSLTKPFVQLGIFSQEANATRTAGQMRGAGIVPTVKKQTSQGRTFWRVIVGPAQTSAERSELLTKVKGMGFADAYAVTN